jgi:hypothetical protein
MSYVVGLTFFHCLHHGERPPQRDGNCRRGRPPRHGISKTKTGDPRKSPSAQRSRCWVPRVVQFRVVSARDNEGSDHLPLGHPKDHIAASRTPMFAATESPVSMAHKMGTMERCAGPPRQAGGRRRTAPTRNSIGRGGSDATLTPSHRISSPTAAPTATSILEEPSCIHQAPRPFLTRSRRFCGTRHRAVRFGALNGVVTPPSPFRSSISALPCHPDPLDGADRLRFFLTKNLRGDTAPSGQSGRPHRPIPESRPSRFAAAGTQREKSSSDLLPHGGTRSLPNIGLACRMYSRSPVPVFVAVRARRASGSRKLTGDALDPVRRHHIRAMIPMEASSANPFHDDDTYTTNMYP